MVEERFDEILISHNANAIRSKHNWSIQRWDRAYHDLKENRGMHRDNETFFHEPVIDTSCAVGRKESINFNNKLEKH